VAGARKGRREKEGRIRIERDDCFPNSYQKEEEKEESEEKEEEVGCFPKSFLKVVCLTDALTSLQQRLAGDQSNSVHVCVLRVYQLEG